MEAVDVEVVLAVEGRRGNERDLVRDDPGDGDVDGKPSTFLVALGSAINHYLPDYRFCWPLALFLKAFRAFPP